MQPCVHVCVTMCVCMCVCVCVCVIESENVSTDSEEGLWIVALSLKFVS